MTASPAAPVRTVPESKLHLSANTPQKSQGQWEALHSPGALASLLLCPGRLLRAWKGLHYSPEAPSQSEGTGTALENYLITGQESKGSFRTFFLALVSRICFWVSSQAPCVHKKPGKHLTLQLRHSQDRKELPCGGKQCCADSHWNMAVT